jgi:hypothetical protein
LFGVEQQEFTSDDYYTPAWVFERMGIRFDLDVCSPPGGPPFVPADNYYTQVDDGLTSEWYGRVWMNPPYGRCFPWWDRFNQHRHGVALLPVTKSLTFNSVIANADAITFDQETDGINFHRPEGVPNKKGRRGMRIWFPLVFAAFGDECVDAISRLGPVRVLR